MTDKAKIKLSIIIPTYNHSQFIADALESVLLQKTNFNFEVIIGDDCSTDNNQTIIKQYTEKYPEIIKSFFHDKNMGVFQLVKRLYLEANGDYIAILEGDDKWSYEYKLQKQIDFLNKNTQYEAVFHDVKIASHITNEDLKNNLIRKQSKKVFNFYSEKFKYPKEYKTTDLIDRKNIPSSSLVFRNKDYSVIFDKYNDINLTLGWLIQLYIIKNGAFKYIPEVWAIYNDHKGGVTKQINFTEFNKTNIFIFKSILNDPFYREFKKNIFKSLSTQYKYLYHNPNEQRKIRHLLLNYYYLTLHFFSKNSK